MKFLNLNAIQTYLSAILAGMLVLLPYLGCSVDAVTSSVDCANAIISPTLLSYVAMAASFLKFVLIPAVQPGGWFRNLFEPKVPVSSSGDVGTVTAAQVASTTAGKPKQG